MCLLPLHPLLAAIRKRTAGVVLPTDAGLTPSQLESGHLPAHYDHHPPQGAPRPSHHILQVCSPAAQLPLLLLRGPAGRACQRGTTNTLRLLLMVMMAMMAVMMMTMVMPMVMTMVMDILAPMVWTCVYTCRLGEGSKNTALKTASCASSQHAVTIQRPCSPCARTPNPPQTLNTHAHCHTRHLDGCPRWSCPPCDRLRHPAVVGMGRHYWGPIKPILT